MTDPVSRRRWIVAGIVAAFVVVVLVVAGVLVAGDDDEDVAKRSVVVTTATAPTTVPVTTTTPATTSAPVTTTTAAACTLPGGGVARQSLPADGGRTQMASVQILPAGSAGLPPGVPACAQHVVFFFDALAGGVAHPALVAEYRDGPLRLSPSDLPVSVAGDAYLVVRLEPAQNHTDAGTGPIVATRISGPSSGVVREVVLLEDFEGIVQYAIGLDRKVPFALSTAVTGSSSWISFGA